MTSAPVLVSTRAELDRVLATTRKQSVPVGLVPTMGALHEGHASLVRVARERGPVVVSIFVNPMQFGPDEDLDRYPRTLEADLEVCRREGAQVVFAPTLAEVYPDPPGAAALRDGRSPMTEPQVTVDPGALAGVLEGADRPGHFRGVLTVVAKLFGLVRPDLAVFGEKDYQQLTLIRQMVLDLNMSVEVIGAPIQRAPSGLALSSRNRYLDSRQQEKARTLHRALRAAVENAETADSAQAAAQEVLAGEPEIDVGYLAVTDAHLGPLPEHPPPGTAGRILVAAKVGATRLIDNMPLVLGADRGDLPRGAS